MKKAILFFAAVIAFYMVTAQKYTLPPYLQVPVVPAFNIMLTDSSMFNKKDIPKKKPVVMIYFDPECGHCQAEAQELSKNMDRFKKVFFVMASYNSLELIKEFGVAYGLDQFSNIRLGRDVQYFLPVFYQVKTTPFSAVYNKKGSLIKAFEHGMTIEDLQQALK